MRNFTPDTVVNTGMAEEIVNRVQKSKTLLLDLEEHYPGGKRMEFDLKTFLHEGLIIKEKEFREALKEHDWEQYSGACVGIHCSSDTIIPGWAYMLPAGYLSEYAEFSGFGTKDEIEPMIFEHFISSLNLEDYENKRVIIKGCSKKKVPQHAYIRLAQLLSNTAKSVMYGEPCSTVPIFKKKKY